MTRAAELTQPAFESAQLEIQVGGRNEFTHRWGLMPRKRMLFITYSSHSQEMLSNEPSQVYPEIPPCDCTYLEKIGIW